MQIRVSPEAAAAAKHDSRMTVDEFLARFPEVPRDLRDEPVLAQYVDAFGLLLREAQKPTPCMGAEGGDAGHRFYTALVNDLAIYGIGLAKRDRTLARLAKRLEDYRKQPATYACTLVPHRTPGTPRAGCQP
jgi:predicted metalloprotease with PDZ domain